MEVLLKAHQLHGLGDAGVAHQHELRASADALLGELHKNAEAGGVDEINATQIDHKRQGVGLAPLADEGAELLIGVGVKLADESEQQAVRLPLAASSQGDGQSLQVGDCSSPRIRVGQKCRERFRDGGNCNESFRRSDPDVLTTPALAGAARSAIAAAGGHQRHETAEVMVGVMGARACLRVVLHSEHRLARQLECGDGVVVEIVVGDAHPSGRQ
jgi:hypothetical protein